MSAVRFRPIRGNHLWHIARDVAVSDSAFSRTVLCGRMQGAFHVNTLPTSEWASEKSAWKVEGISCDRCSRRYVAISEATA